METSESPRASQKAYGTPNLYFEPGKFLNEFAMTFGGQDVGLPMYRPYLNQFEGLETSWLELVS
jgi:hypothetical protein